MDAAEQESLLLRQVAALDRAGLDRSAALAAAAHGLGQGPLGRRVAEAQRAMAGGASADELLDDAEVLELRAQGLEAGLLARGAVRRLRAFVVVAVVLPLVGWTVVPLVMPWPPMVELGTSVPSWQVLDLLGRAGWLGVPLAALVLWGLKRLDGWAPGARQLQAAEALLGGRTPGLREHELTYLELRRGAVGDRVARRELAAELVAEGTRFQAFFEAVAPPVAAVALCWFLGVVVALATLPLFALAGSV